MIANVNISDQELKELNEKGTILDTERLNLHEISKSGSHIAELLDD